MTRRSGESLATLTDSHRPALVRFLNRKLGCIEDARDVAQDALLRMHRLESSEGIENSRAFLFQVASNLAIDMLRRRSLHARFLGEEAARLGDVGEPLDAATPEGIVAARQQLRLILDTIDKLPPRPRRALLLQRSHGLSYAEIASEMGVSVSSVEKYILEALRHCRRQLIP